MLQCTVPRHFGIHIFTNASKVKTLRTLLIFVSPPEPLNNLSMHENLQCWMLSFFFLVQWRNLCMDQLSPRKENEQKLNVLATVKHITECHRKDDSVETVKLCSAHLSSPKSHHAEMNLLAGACTDPQGISQMRNLQPEAVECQFPIRQQSSKLHILLLVACSYHHSLPDQPECFQSCDKPWNIWQGITTQGYHII